MDAKWPHVLNAIDDPAMSAFAGIERENADWLEAHWEEMQPVTEARRIAMLSYKLNPCHSTQRSQSS